MRLTHAVLLILFVTAAGSCGNSEPLSPLRVGQHFDLRTVNGQALPWSPPGSAYQIVEGWIQIDSDTLAERHEKQEEPGSLTRNWTYGGRFTIHGDTLIMDYGPPCPSCGPGPEMQADTFTVSARALRRREVSPPDSIVRYYALP